jgi:UDP-glucose 4-epimerase
MPTGLVRSAAPYGPSKVRKIMPSFICRSLAGEPIEVYGDGSQIMDVIYVADVAKVLVGALESTAAGGPLAAPGLVAEPEKMRTFEAGTGRATTVNEIAQAVVEEVLRQTGQVIPVNHLPMRPGEDERSVVLGQPDTLKPLGIVPEEFVPLEEGVRRTVAHFIEERE